MKCLKCGMSHYFRDWYGDLHCPCCGLYPEYHNTPIPATMHEDGTPVIKERDYDPHRYIHRGCRWWNGELPDGTNKTCFNCGWGDCIRSDMAGDGSSNNYKYRSLEGRDEVMEYPDGREDCYDPRKGKEPKLLPPDTATGALPENQ